MESAKMSLDEFRKIEKYFSIKKLSELIKDMDEINESIENGMNELFGLYNTGALTLLGLTSQIAEYNDMLLKQREGFVDDINNILNKYDIPIEVINTDNNI